MGITGNPQAPEPDRPPQKFNLIDPDNVGPVR